MSYGVGSVTLSNIRRRHSAITVQADVADVVTFDGQLVVITVSANGEEQPPRSAFSFVYDERSYDTLLDDGGEQAYSYYVLPDAYVPGELSGWIGFEIPGVVDGNDDPRIRLRHEGVECSWPLPR